MKTAVELEVALRSLQRCPRPFLDEATETWVQEILAQNYWRSLCEGTVPPRRDAPAASGVPADAVQA